MHMLIQDLRFTVRQLRKNLGFTLTAVLTLALGIGATTSIFSLVNAVLLRPLPYPEPSKLMSLLHENHVGGAVTPLSVSYPDFFDWRAQNRSFSAMASYRDERFALTDAGQAESVDGEIVAADFFRVLGVHPMLGRDFAAADEKPGQHVVMLSHELWQSKFGAQSDIVGKTIRLDGNSYTVAGVMPAEFGFPMQNPAPEMWSTLAADAVDPEGGTPLTTQRGAEMLTVIGRLKPGVTTEQARADMDLIDRNLATQYPESNKHLTSAQVTPELEALVGDARPALRMLFSAVGLLLLIACANVAGLLLARASRRHAEIALRAALGATRAEIIRQVLVESVTLSLLGGMLGLVFSTLLLKVLPRFVPAQLPRMDAIPVDGTVLGFAIAASVITGVLFGVLPAWRMSKLDPSQALREGARSVTSGRSHYRLHSILVVAETALGLILLVGSGLFIRSFVRVLQVNPGFDRRNVLTASLGYPDGKTFGTDVVAFYDELLPKVEGMPGVKSAAAGFPLPFSGSGIGLTFEAEGHPVAKGDEPASRAAIVTPNYFNTLRIPLLRGRDFAATDAGKAPLVAIVSESFARKYFPGEDPIGKHMTPGLDDGVHGHGPRQIVGIVGDIKISGLTRDAKPMFYLPFAQAVITSPALAIRTAGDPVSLISPLRAQINAINRNVPVSHVHTLDDMVSDAASQPRFSMLLLTSFAVMALLLAAVGLYAVLSYMVAQRTSEMGLRLALGAQRGDVLRLILKRGLMLAGIGITVGLAASAVLTRFASSLLYGVHAFDPATYIAVTVVFLLISLVASAAPAVRAASVDPGKTLRDS
jgi:predicted permease